MRDTVHHDRSHERGSALVTTISVGAILLAMMLVVQFGLAYYAQQVLSGAAQDGAVTAARRDSSMEEGRRFADHLVAQSGSSLLLSQQTTVFDEGDRAVVTIRGEVVSLIPFVRSLTVQASGSAPFEEFNPQEVGS